jgi:hypothetical protein
VSQLPSAFGFQRRGPEAYGETVLAAWAAPMITGGEPAMHSPLRRAAKALAGLVVAGSPKIPPRSRNRDSHELMARINADRIAILKAHQLLRI